MRIRESGMPTVDVWQRFFKPKAILLALGLSEVCEHAVEFGCGYGTFTVPAAKLINGKLTALEIDPEMISHTQKEAARANLDNIFCIEADFSSASFLLDKQCADFVMLFNILHGENPSELLSEAYELLVPGGSCGVIHWNYDPDTPRGPPMAIRPKPEILASLAEAIGFSTGAEIDLPPYHYGFRLRKEPS